MTLLEYEETLIFRLEGGVVRVSIDKGHQMEDMDHLDVLKTTLSTLLSFVREAKIQGKIKETVGHHYMFNVPFLIFPND